MGMPSLSASSSAQSSAATGGGNVFNAGSVFGNASAVVTPANTSGSNPINGTVGGLPLPLVLLGVAGLLAFLWYLFKK
ncbi:MAG: hypothetical protein WCS94_08320 [Verrucomicrobiota bacterium]